MVFLFKSGQKDVAPNTFAVTTVINSYACSGHPDAGKNADRLLKLMRELKDEYGLSSFAINTSIMNSVLSAWSSCGDENAGNRAESYLNLMEQATEKESELHPDTWSYLHVLMAWSKSSCLDKLHRALRTLRRMKDQDKMGNPNVSVNEHALSLVIKTCAFSNFGVDAEADAYAFEIAVELFDEILESNDHYPTSLSTGWFIQACGRLRVPEREKSIQIERAFMLCRRAGLVNDFILHRLKGAASEALYRKLTGTRFDSRTNAVNMSELPYSWRKNCSKEKEFRRRGFR
jgi:hypothetical protein